ncbi:MAG TPA: glycosyltransferase, partial [bacterium]|nr:glycosyltransferase [bacterium]
AHTGVSCHYLPLAYDDAVFAPATEQAAKQYQVVMVGERFPLRAACLAALDGVVADVWGGDFRDVPNCRCHPPVPPAAANRIYQQAVLCFNAHHPQSVWDSNARVFEVAGAGGCLLTDAKQALTGQFRIGEEVLTYSSPAEFADKARFLLAHPEVAAAIGARAAQRARREHTYAARIRRLLADCG